MRSLEITPAVGFIPTAPRPGRAGFGELLESLRPEVLRFAYWLARDRAMAEDVVQETLLRAWRSQGSLKDRGAARAWLLTIARREHARLYERKRLDLVSLEEGLEEGHFAAAPAASHQEGEELRDAILKLPIGYRQPLVMQVLGGFTTAEIARELGLSLTATLTRLFRARNRLRELCGYGPPERSLSRVRQSVIRHRLSSRAPARGMGR